MAGEHVVLRTKLFPPRARASVVLRERLLARLRQGLDVPLTLVVAPAGWGKSTLVGDWLRQDGCAAGWLSLDRADEDPNRFWRHFLLAAATPPPHVGREALRRLEAAGSDVLRDVVPTFLNEVLAVRGPVRLVLDDYHLIADPQAHATLGLVLERAPENLHLVVISRSEPALPLSRLRVRGELVEVRAEHLRFTQDEAVELLNDRMGLGLGGRDVDRLLARTEGWAAGLQLAALRLRDHRDAPGFIDAFTGADRHIMEYLGQEVLGSLTPGVRRFLLLTSVLDRFCAPLCEAVTRTPGAGAMLTDLVRANLFLIPLDDELRWFRYHHLFGGLLRHELDRGHPGVVTQLRVRAAEWHARHGNAGEAVEYAVQAQAVDLAAHLVARAWRTHFNAGQWATVQRWLTVLPPDRVAAEPSLSVGAVWIALDNGHLERAASALDAAEAAGADDVHLQVLRGLLLYKLGDLSAARDHLERLDSGGDQERFDRTVTALVRGLLALWSGELDDGDRLLATAARLAEEDGNRLAWIYATGCQALIAVHRDDRPRARELLEGVERQVEESLSEAHFVAMFPALARSRLALQDHDWDVARQAAARAVDLARRGAARGELAAALLTAAVAERRFDEAHARDDGAAACSASWASQARTVMRGCPDPGPVLGSWLAGEQRAGTRPAVPQPVEPLTDRELSVLRLLPGTASQRELAATLFVTPNTLKTHLRAVYRKLGARSRADAVLRAREHGLL